MWKQILTKITEKSKCTKDCRTCPLLFSCLDKKAMLKPVPRWLWMTGIAALSMPVFVAYGSSFIPSLVPLVAGDELIGEVTDTSLLLHYRDIFRKVGVRNPENVHIIETKNLGPMAIGSNFATSYIFIPSLLNRVNLPHHQFTISHINDVSNEKEILFSGTGDELTDEIRETVLKNTGTILPTSEEVDYIIGHEAAHIVSHHSLLTSLLFSSSVLSSHMFIKSYNYAVTKYKLPFAPSMKLGIMKGYLPYSLITIALSAISMTLSSWQIEKSADMQSAEKLHCRSAALSLIEKKIQQNKLESSLFITKSGNDFRSLEHPPLTLQRTYIDSIHP